MRIRFRVFVKRLIIFATIALAVLGSRSQLFSAEEEPAALVPDVVDFSKLIPLLPDGPTGWNSDKADGSTTDAAGTRITSVHRDYKKGDDDKAPTVSISILDSAANPEYVSATTSAWNLSTTTPEGYTKALKIDDMPGFETFENEGKHGTLWVMVAKRYVLQIETMGLDAREIGDWLKRIDLKKLSAVK